MRLEVVCQERMGILRDIIALIVDFDISIIDVEIVNGDRVYIEIDDIAFERLQQLLPAMRRVESVSDVKTTPVMPLRRDRAVLDAMLSSFTFPIFAVDQAGRIIAANSSFRGLLEVTDEQLKGISANSLSDSIPFDELLTLKPGERKTFESDFLEQSFTVDASVCMVKHNVLNEAEVSKFSILIIRLLVDGAIDTVAAGGAASSMARVTSQSISAEEGANISVGPNAWSNFAGISVESAKMKQLLAAAERVATQHEPILIYGEPGTGKLELARKIHALSPLAERAFEVIDCQTHRLEVDDARELLAAHQGTLVFSHCDQLSLDTQTEIYKSLSRLYAHKQPDELMLRCLFTASSDLATLCEQQKFDASLWHYINTYTLHIPPLRERRDDIIPLAKSLLKDIAASLEQPLPRFSKAALDYLVSYPWPANNRQLANSLRRALTFGTRKEITKTDIQQPTFDNSSSVIDENFTGTLEDEVKKFEGDLLRKLYPHYPSTRLLAKKLGLSHTAIANKLREYGISKNTIKM